ncbi:hypothetical protein CSUI_000874 [Cystoisospora suis]|uniref:Uncharacterized protein n=1 Tax=Cystoisospora suis TaxID=483139 RepID=A0A2C6KMN2_9APIC|nr:hypothetical protein CSUI_000874 [Cystoisospora suis]
MRGGVASRRSFFTREGGGSMLVYVQVFPSRLSGFSSRQLSMLANAYLRLDLSDDPLLPPLFRAAEQRLPTCDWHSLALLLQAATKASARGGFEKEFFFSSFSHEASHLICYALLHRNSLHPSKLRALQLLSSSSSSSRILEREEAKISSFSSDLLLPSSMSHVSHDSPAMTTTSHSCGNNGYNERHTVDTASCLDSPSSQLVDGSSPSSSSSSLLGREDQGVVERQNDEVHFLHERKEKKRENKHKKSDASGDSCLLFASDRGKDKEIDFSKFSPPFRSTLLTSHMSSSSASVICYSISKSHSLLLLSSLHPVSTTTSHHHSSSDLSSSPYKSEREEEEEERERVISRDMTSAISIRHSSLVRSPCLSPYSSLQERQGGSCLAHEESLSSLASSTSLPKSEERTKEEERSSEAASEENLVTRKRRKERIFQLWLMAELTQLAMSFVSTFSITELSNTSSAIGQFCEVFQQHLRQKTFLKEETDMSHCILSSSHSTSHGFLSLSASHEEARTQERKCPENEVSTSHVKRTLESDGDHVAIEREERRDKEEERRRGEREEEVFMNGEKREALKRDTSHVPLNDKKEKIKNDQGGDGRERNTFSKMSDIEKHEVRKEGILSQADMTSPHQEKEDEEDQHEIPERKDSPGFCIDESEKELEKFLMATFTDFFKRVEERIASSSISKEFSYFSKRQLHFSELIKILKSFRSFQDCLILGEAQLKDRDKDMSTPTKRKTGDMHLNLHDGSSLEERRRKEESRRREVVEKLICRNVDLLQTVTLLPLSQLMEVLQSLKIENEDLLEIVTSHQHKLRKKKKKISNLHSSTHTLSYPPSPSPSPHSSSPSVHRYSQ